MFTNPFILGRRCCPCGPCGSAWGWGNSWGSLWGTSGTTNIYNILSGALQVQIFLCKVCWQLQISEANISYIKTKLIKNIGIVFEFFRCCVCTQVIDKEWLITIPILFRHSLVAVAAGSMMLELARRGWRRSARYLQLTHKDHLIPLTTHYNKCTSRDTNTNTSWVLFRLTGHHFRRPITTSATLCTPRNATLFLVKSARQRTTTIAWHCLVIVDNFSTGTTTSARRTKSARPATARSAPRWSYISSFS